MVLFFTLYHLLLVTNSKHCIISGKNLLSVLKQCDRIWKCMKMKILILPVVAVLDNYDIWLNIPVKQFSNC